MIDAENLPLAKFWFDIVQSIAIVGVGIYAWIRDTNKGQDSRIKKVEEQTVHCPRHRQDTQSNSEKIEKLERDLNSLPSRSELNRLDDSIKNLSQQLGTVTGRLEGINRAADLMNEFLINQGAKK